MFNKVYTSKKTGSVNVTDKQDASVYDFDMELEEEKPCNTFNSGSDKYYFANSFSRKSKLPVTMTRPSSDRQAQQSAFGRFQNENQVSTSNRDLMQGKSRQKSTVSKDNQITITASRARLGQLYSRFPVVTFTLKGVEVKTIKGSEKVLSRQWPIKELCDFKSFYSFHHENAEEKKAIVLLRFHSKRVLGSCSNDICNVEEEFFVMEVDNQEWVEQQRKILAMSEKYKKVWKRLDRPEMEVKETLSRSPLKELTGNVHLTRKNDPECYPESCSTSSRPSEEFHILETLIFPEGDPDAVTITRKDVEILRPTGFLNDTIIDFYIKYLQTKVPPKDQERFYFFNSFFFRKLVDSSKALTDSDQGKVSYERVRKWTRKVNLFQKDYVFIPVNQSLHWSLIIICHLGNLGRSPDESIGTPCILHLDSLEGSHEEIEEHIRNYISQAWIEKEQIPNGDNPEGVLSHMRYIEADVPQQNNHCDCGTYLLHYVELFLKAAPLHFSLAPTQGFPYFLTRNWFKSSEASAKRRVIQDIMRQLHQASLSSASDRPAISPTGSTELQATAEDDVFISSDRPAISPHGSTNPQANGDDDVFMSSDRPAISPHGSTKQQANDEDDVIISSESEIIRSDLVVSPQRQICDQLEATAKQFECLETSPEVETLSVTDLSNSDEHSGGSPAEDEWRSDSGPDDKPSPSISTFSANINGPDSSALPVPVEVTPSVVEFSPSFDEGGPAGCPLLMDSKYGPEEQEKLFSAVDGLSCRKRPKLMMAFSDLEEGSTAHVLGRSPEERRKSITEVSMVDHPLLPGGLLVRKSKYFTNIQCCEDIHSGNDRES